MSLCQYLMYNKARNMYYQAYASLRSAILGREHREENSVTENMIAVLLLWEVENPDRRETTQK